MGNVNSQDAQERFLKWLRNNRDQIVGMTGVSSRCPLTQWIRYETGAGYAVASNRIYYDMNGYSKPGDRHIVMEEPLDLAHWMPRMMEIVDSIHAIPGSAVRGKDVLKRLEVM